MARYNYTILIAVNNGIPWVMHTNIEEVEGEKNLINKWTEQREAKAAYFDYPNGRLLMHSVLGVTRNG